MEQDERCRDETGVTDKGGAMQKDEWLSTKHFGRGIIWLRRTRSHFSCLGKTATILLPLSQSLCIFTPIMGT